MSLPAQLPPPSSTPAPACHVLADLGSQDIFPLAPLHF